MAKTEEKKEKKVIVDRKLAEINEDGTGMIEVNYKEKGLDKTDYNDDIEVELYIFTTKVKTPSDVNTLIELLQKISDN